MEFYWRNPATSSVQDPTTVCFLNPGTYTVQLIVSNGTGIDTLTKTDYITVECLYSANRGIQCRPVQISVSVLASISQMKSINGANAWNGYFGRNSEHFNWSESATNLLLHSGIVFRYTNCCTTNLVSWYIGFNWLHQCEHLSTTGSRFCHVYSFILFKYH